MILYFFSLFLFGLLYSIDVPTILTPLLTSQTPEQTMEVSNHTQSTLSRSNSRASSISEIEKEFIDLEISGVANKLTSTLKKRISSSRTPAKKAKRIKFFRNGDKFYCGSTIPVSNERYR